MFEDYLRDIHAKQAACCDDDMPDDYERWLCELDSDEIIKYANDWHKEYET